MSAKPEGEEWFGVTAQLQRSRTARLNGGPSSRQAARSENSTSPQKILTKRQAHTHNGIVAGVHGVYQPAALPPCFA